MGKRDKKDKPELSKKEKLKKLFSIWLCSFLVLLIAVVLLIYYGYRDPYRNTYNKTEATPTSLIEKNIIDGFKDTKNTGKFSFRLSNDDVNQMLSYVTKDDLGKRGESIYYVTQDNHYYFMVDLKGIVNVKSRVVIDTYITEYTQNNEVLLGLIKATTGRMPYTKPDYLCDSFFEMVSSKSLLPISYSGEASKFTISPLKFLDYLPDGEFMDMIKELVKENPKVVSLTSDTPFGFDIDLSSVRSSYLKDNLPSEVENIDIVSNIKNEVPSDIFLSLEEGVDTEIYNFSLDDFNSVIRHSFNEVDTLSETYTSALTSNKVDIKLSDVYAVLEVDKIKYISNVSINDYIINFWVDSTLLNVDNNFCTDYQLDSYVSTGGATLAMNSGVGQMIFSKLNLMFTYLNDNTSFIDYNDTSLTVSLNFEELFLYYSGLEGCICNIRQDNINLDKFSLFVCR